MRDIIRLAVLVSALSLIVTGCTSDSGGSPASPSAITESADSDADAAARNGVSLQGIIRAVDLRRQAFVLIVRTDRGTARRVIRMNDRTEVWAGDRRVRPGVLTDGMLVNVRGVATDRAVLARKILILRRATR